MFCTAALMLCSLASQAQAKLVQGNLAFLKGQNNIKVEYRYDGMMVGKITEEAYVAEKVADKNKSKEGKGDEWKRKWDGDKKIAYQPEFEMKLNRRAMRIRSPSMRSSSISVWSICRRSSSNCSSK